MKSAAHWKRKWSRAYDQLCEQDALLKLKDDTIRELRAEVARLQKLEADSDRWGQVAVVLVNHGWRLQSEDEDVPAAVDRWLSGMGGEE